jgi:nitrogen regulatory protein PII
MKMIWAVIRSTKVEAVARELKKVGVSGCTVSPVRGYGEDWHLYEPLVHGGHHKIEAIIEDQQADLAVKKIVEQGSTGLEGDGILSVLDLAHVVSVRSKRPVAGAIRRRQPLSRSK